MFWVKLIVAVVSLFLFRLVNEALEEDELDASDDYYKTLRIITIIAIILGIIFCILMIATSWNIMIIPKIMLFISLCLYALFKEDSAFECTPFLIGIISTFLTFIVTGGIYLLMLMITI